MQSWHKMNLGWLQQYATWTTRYILIINEVAVAHARHRCNVINSMPRLDKKIVAVLHGLICVSLTRHTTHSSSTTRVYHNRKVY
jgi:hypothetical protein